MTTPQHNTPPRDGSGIHNPANRAAFNLAKNYPKIFPDGRKPYHTDIDNILYNSSLDMLLFYSNKWLPHDITRSVTEEKIIIALAAVKGKPAIVMATDNEAGPHRLLGIDEDGRAAQLLYKQRGRPNILTIGDPTVGWHLVTDKQFAKFVHACQTGGLPAGPAYPALLRSEPLPDVVINPPRQAYVSIGAVPPLF